MQLFSLGLCQLNDDGTPVINPSTQKCIETYSNVNIESFARAWTGFVFTAARGNVEEKQTSANNKIDPLRIEATYRDPFPKTDLQGGYIGDGMPLCVDLPNKSFLKKGAVYRLLGGSTIPLGMTEHGFFLRDTTAASQYNEVFNITRFVLNETSSLYQELHNGGQYQLTVELTTDLDCDPNNGYECLVDTVRVVKVDSVYYEFVERPCVQLPFYNRGKQIQARANMRPQQMCANTALPHAMEACCDQTKYGDTNATRETLTTYFYEGERMKYDTARSRCIDYGKDICKF